MGRRVLVPGWIVAFGLVALSVPPLGAAASLGLFVVGVGVLPAAVSIVGARGWRLTVEAPAGRFE